MFKIKIFFTKKSIQTQTICKKITVKMFNSECVCVKQIDKKNYVKKNLVSKSKSFFQLLNILHLFNC